MGNNKSLFISNSKKILEFTKEYILFVFYLGSFFLLNFLVNLYLKETTSPNLDTNVLIMGDSHGERAVDPTYFHSAINISQSAEPLVLTYWKLKDIIEENNIDTVLISLSYHNLSAFNDLKYIDNRWSKEMMRRSFDLVDYDDLDKVDFDWNEFLKRYFRDMCLYPHTKHHTHIGKYVTSEESKLTNLDINVNRQFYDGEETYEVSEKSEYFLEQIIRLTKNENITLMFIKPPVHKDYLNSVPLKFRDHYKAIINQITQSGIKVIQIEHVNFDDFDFFDFDHLNLKGSQKYTKELINALKPN